MNEKITVLCVVGPTASGKTALGARLARTLGGEVVSADSMQIYRGMPIASAVPSAEEMLGVPHHLIEFADPDTEFTVADYTSAAKRTISDISSRGRLPVIVGGTGLYVNSLIDNIEFIKQENDPALRERLAAEYRESGGKAMLEKLRLTDPETADKLHANDEKRIIRAFEIQALTGSTVSRQNMLSRRNGSPYRPVMIGITYRDRAVLYGRIDRRVDTMLENGLLDEAYADFTRGGSGTAVQAIGHKELYPYFRGEVSPEQAVESLKRATRRYAKRQLTWFRRDERIHWIFADETQNVLDEALKIFKEETV